MKFKKLMEKKWYHGAVIACIGVAFYVLLTHLGGVLSAVGSFLGNFRAIFLAVVFAYVINPLAKFFYYRVFKKMKLGKKRWALSVALAFLTGLLALALLIGTLIPQLAQSVRMLSENYENYSAKLIVLIDGSPLKALVNSDQLHTLSENALDTIQKSVLENARSILSSAANSGRQVLSTVIALILAVYLLMDKTEVLKGTRRLIRAVLRQETTESLLSFLLRCDSILISYLGQSLLDSLIVGGVNAVAMAVCGMEYIGLVSVVVAVTNLVPNFGPAIGAAVGAFILVLVNPWHALLFLVITLLLQTVDAYILKPKLFADSLGVSGLLILVATIVFGNLFGILGVLLAIPAAAILSFLYRDYLLPRQEEHMRQKREEETAE